MPELSCWHEAKTGDIGCYLEIAQENKSTVLVLPEMFDMLMSSSEGIFLQAHTLQNNYQCMEARCFFLQIKK